MNPKEFVRSPKDDRREIPLPVDIKGKRFSLPALLGFRNKDGALLRLDAVGAKRFGFQDTPDEMEDKLTQMELEDDGEMVKRTGGTKT